MNFLPLDVALSGALDVVRHFPTTDAALSVLATAKNAIDAAMAELVQESMAGEKFKDHGFSSINAYLRERLHLSGGEANQVKRRGQTIRRLADQIGDDAADGTISAKHVDEFGYAITTLTEDALRVPEVAGVLTSAAREADPTVLRGLVKQAQNVLLPEALEKAYVDGMDRKDLKLSPLADGYVLTAFLPIDVGAKLQTYLSSTTAPTVLPDGSEDTRTSAQRRLDAFEVMIDATLQHGLPTDNGIRPHLSILMDHETLIARQTKHADLDGSVKPAHLVGFGPIGETLAGQLMCDAQVTPILTSTKCRSMDVGKPRRTAPSWMKQGISARQGDCCAAPGCTNRIHHFHHVIEHAQGGPTTFENMIGLCGPCHRLVHTRRLKIDPVTHAFTRPSGVTSRFNPANKYLREQAIHRRLKTLFHRVA